MMTPLVLLALGIVLIMVEIFFFSFFLLFIGLGFFITAGIEYFVGFANFGDAYVGQALSIALFSILSLLLLRKPIKSWFAKSQAYTDPLQEGGGMGEIKQGMVYFKGTLWACDQDLSHLKEGERIKVMEIKDNKAVIDQFIQDSCKSHS